MFVCKASSMLKELNEFNSEIFKNCKKSLRSKVDLDFLRLDKESFSKCTDISIDVAVFEKTKKSICSAIRLRMGRYWHLGISMEYF